MLLSCHYSTLAEALSVLIKKSRVLPVWDRVEMPRSLRRDGERKNGLKTNIKYYNSTLGIDSDRLTFMFLSLHCFFIQKKNTFSHGLFPCLGFFFGSSSGRMTVAPAALSHRDLWHCASLPSYFQEEETGQDLRAGMWHKSLRQVGKLPPSSFPTNLQHLSRLPLCVLVSH